MSPADQPTFGYPGSPEPLDFGEAGQHYVLLLNVDSTATTVEALPVNEVTYRSEQIDVSAMSTSDEIREAIVSLTGGSAEKEIIRVTLEGQADADLRIDQAALLSATADVSRYLDIVDATTVSLPLDDLTQEMTTRGAFVRLMNERIQNAEGAERQRLEGARLHGLRAFENQEVRRRANRTD